MSSVPVGAITGSVHQPQPPHKRIRKEHSKSRNGCQSCKKRHVRCDQARPMCSNCLVRGDPCVYGTASHSSGVVGRQSIADSTRREYTFPSTIIIGPYPDPFESWGIDMPYHSYQLMYHHLSYRVELHRLILRNSDSNKDLLTTSNPDFTCKRCFLLMSAKHHYGLTGRCDWSRERTFLYHKTQVVRSLIDQINANPSNPGDWSLSVMIILTWMDSLEQDTNAAEAHLRALITLMTTKQPQEKGLYTYGRMLLKLGMLFLSLVEASKKSQSDIEFVPPQWRHSSNPLAPVHSWDWANVAYILLLLVGEFLVKDGFLLVSNPENDVDIAVLQWLRNEVRALYNIDGQPSNPSGLGRYRDTQHKMWVLGAACYALLLASVSEPAHTDTTITASSEKAIREDEAAEIKLQELRVWWHKRIVEWMGTKKLPWCSLSMEILGKVAWLTSLDGEPVLAQLYYDSLSRIRNRGS